MGPAMSWGYIGYFHFGKNHASLFRDTQKSALSWKNRPSYLTSKALSTVPACDYSSFRVKRLYGPARGLLACVMGFGCSLSRFLALVWVFLPRCEGAGHGGRAAALSLGWLFHPWGRFRNAGRGAMCGTVAQARGRIVSCQPVGYHDLHDPLPRVPCALMPAKRKAIRLLPCVLGHLPRV